MTIFFWLCNPTVPKSDFTTYRFNSILFDATCSPFILSALLLKHLKDNRCTITEKLTIDFYVDNFLSSCKSEKLSNHYNTARKLFSDDAFSLRSLASNNKVLQKLATVEKYFYSIMNYKLRHFGYIGIRKSIH